MKIHACVCGTGNYIYTYISPSDSFNFANDYCDSAKYDCLGLSSLVCSTF